MDTPIYDSVVADQQFDPTWPAAKVKATRHKRTNKLAAIAMIREATKQ